MSVHERVARALGEAIVEQPGRVVLAFLVVTGILAVGLGGISTEAGTDQFTQDSDASEALEAVNQEFGATFESDTGSTQLIQRDTNVLGKPALLRMLRTQERLSEREGLRVTNTASAAGIVARTLAPGATTLEAQIRAVEHATPGEIDTAVNRAEGSLSGLLSKDFNAGSASASATIATVTHAIPGAGGGGAGVSGSSPLQSVQTEAIHVIDATESGAGIEVFGSGILSSEFSSVILDSLIIVTPAAAGLILIFLVFSYRDPLDLVLGVVSLVMAIVWTFGFMGLAGIAFTQMLVAVPPLLLAVGIDFGIHTINRYREERAAGFDVLTAMEDSVEQLLVAFFIVTGTTVLGFMANVTSDLGPIRDFGIVAAVGITFTFLIFGLFLPATKVLTDRFGERAGIPRFGGNPLGDENSLLGKVLPAGLVAARKAPYVFCSSSSSSPRASAPTGRA
jgi:predicted RND superfamily exporter protein